VLAGDSRDADRSRDHIETETLGSKNLRKAAIRAPAQVVHLPEAILRHRVAKPEEQRVVGPCVDMGNSPAVAQDLDGTRPRHCGCAGNLGQPGSRLGLPPGVELGTRETGIRAYGGNRRARAQPPQDVTRG
jgi:hypothetical protein